MYLSHLSVCLVPLGCFRARTRIEIELPSPLYHHHLVPFPFFHTLESIYLLSARFCYVCIQHRVFSVIRQGSTVVRWTGACKDRMGNHAESKCSYRPESLSSSIDIRKIGHLAPIHY